MNVFKNSERHVNISSEIFFKRCFEKEELSTNINDMLTIIRVSYFVLARSKRFSEGEKNLTKMKNR